MILLDNLGGLKRGRFWYNWIPFYLGNHAEIINGSFRQLKVMTTTEFKICCEIALLPREVSNYGLLGMEFFPIDGESVQYEIIYLEQGNEILIDNVALTTDRVYTGMPKEFAVAVKEVMERFKGSEIPVGKYSFITSAYGIVGSSRAVFSKLASILLRLAANNPNSLSMDQMKAIIADEVKKA